MIDIFQFFSKEQVEGLLGEGNKMSGAYRQISRLSDDVTPESCPKKKLIISLLSVLSLLLIASAAVILILKRKCYHYWIVLRHKLTVLLISEPHLCNKVALFNMS